MAENIYCKHNAISFSIYLHVNIFCTTVFFVILLKFRDSFVQCVRKQSKLNTRFSFIFRDSCKFWTNDEKTVIGISISHKSPFIFLSPHNHRGCSFVFVDETTTQLHFWPVVLRFIIIIVLVTIVRVLWAWKTAWNMKDYIIMDVSLHAHTFTRFVSWLCRIAETWRETENCILLL